MKYYCVLVGLLLLAACAANDESEGQPEVQAPSLDHDLIVGADLSYVNEVLDCGGQYTVDGVVTDPYQIFADAGAEIVRLRLWNNPDWTNYSNLADVKRAIGEAKRWEMKVLLDFHYSDTWADPEKQFIPAAWRDLHDNTPALAQTLYDYTYSTLAELDDEGLLPEYVQVGNEINHEILQLEEHMNVDSINWARNKTLLQAGLRAVRDYSASANQTIVSMLHIAQPENALRWFAEANREGLVDYDMVGLSYYAKWSEYSFDNLGEAIVEIQNLTGKPLMVVETSYPWTLQNFDNANNVLGEDALISGYPASPNGQLAYMQKLDEVLRVAEAVGWIYWEPAWISTSCHTLWGEGSHWENATFFDQNGEALPSMTLFNK